MNSQGGGVVRLDASGQVVGTGPLLVRADTPHGLRVLPDGERGALLGGLNGMLTLQRVALDGSLAWGANGLAVPQPPHGEAPLFEPDDVGGARLVYGDTLAQTMHAEHLAADGTFDSDQPLVALGPVVIRYMAISTRTRAGMAWVGLPYPTEDEKSPHRLIVGQAQWNGSQASPLSTATVFQLPDNPSVMFDIFDIVPLGDGSVVVPATVHSPRSDSLGGVPFLCRVDTEGHLGTTEPVILSVRDVPDDDGGFVRLRWRPSDLESASDVTGLVYDVMRSPSIGGPWMAVARGLTSLASGDSLAVPTFADSSASCVCRTYFMVRARADHGIVRDSPPEAGASIADGGLPLDVADDRSPALRLWPLSPYPAHGLVSLRFSLPHAGHVRLSLFDAAGRSVRTLADGDYPAGDSHLSIAAADAAGRSLLPGLYFVKLVTHQGSRVGRMMLAR